MTKVPVNVPGFAPNMLYGTPKVQETDTKGDFGRIFENQKNAGAEVKTQEVTPKDEADMPQEDAVEEVTPKEPQTNEAVEADKANGVQETVETQKGQQSEADANPEGELSEEVLNMVLPILQDAVSDIKTILAQELGMTQEELGMLMEEMGLTETDLLEVGTLREILLQVKGVDDMTALLTDEELYQQIQSLEKNFEAVMTEVKDALQMTKEEFAQWKEQIPTVLSASKETEAPVVLVETTETPVNAEEAEVVKLPQESSVKEDTSKQEGNAFLTPNQNPNAVVLQNGNANGAQQVSFSQTASFVSAETEQIMNQIMDYMKVQLNAETSTLEMQLQPESLGTLQIRITAKEGIMTAQFTTASETVRAALEGQMVQLQQQLENQNIKVDAIEVTVQTHQFESALEQGEERQQAQDGRKTKSRRLDLSRMEDLEEIPQEDKLVAEMMAANGNTVDYLA